LSFVYRFLFSAKWLGYAAVSVVLAAIMVLLGMWQLSRYHERADANARIDAAAAAPPVPVEQVLTAGHTPSAGVAWTKVTATGRYDAAHQIVARDRTFNSDLGFEVLTPLVLDDGTTLVVDRGWIAPGPGGNLVAPTVPAAPSGTVTVVGRIHLPESRSDAVRDGQVKRIAPLRLGLSSPTYDAYLLVDNVDNPAFSVIPSDRQDSGMNAGYVVQWCAFALITLVGFGWAARHEALDGADSRGELDRAAAAAPETPVSPAV
jgi:cytochrome oxidase assembly protein ShyY1